MSDRPIRTVTVVGGGIVGWSAAASLKHRLPALEVSILPLPPSPDSLADRITSTLPSIVGFHADLGLPEADAVLRTGSGYRLGTLFTGWTGGTSEYVHSYSRHGQPFAGASFHLHWIRAVKARRAAAFDSFSPAAALARHARFAPASGEPGAVFGGYEHGLQLNLERYAGMLRAFGRHRRIVELSGTLEGVELREGGEIDRLILDDSRSHQADLYVDATGPAARLRSIMDSARDDWSRLLPCDRVLIAETQSSTDASPLDTVTAAPAGWRWSATSSGATQHGMAYSSVHSSDASAARQLRAATGAETSTSPVHLEAGTRPEPWRGNCVAIGEAATITEPLEWTALHLAHSAIDRLIAMLPDRDFAPVELANYNRQHMAEAIRVRDFLALHYATSKRSEPFWREAARAELPPTLAHTLRLFRERGRLPFHEEETFSRDSWLAVLLGQNVIPRRVDPLAEAISEAQAKGLMMALRQSIDDGLAAHPPLAAYLTGQMRQIAR